MKTVKGYLEGIESINELPTLADLEKLEEKGYFREDGDIHEEIGNMLGENFIIKDGTILSIECSEFHFNCDDSEYRMYQVDGSDLVICMTCGKFLKHRDDIKDRLEEEYKEEGLIHEADYLRSIIFSIEKSDLEIEKYYKNQCNKFAERHIKWLEKQERELKYFENEQENEIERIYDSSGYDQFGYDYDGYDCEGLDECGYNSDGEYKSRR